MISVRKYILPNFKDHRISILFVTFPPFVRCRVNCVCTYMSRAISEQAEGNNQFGIYTILGGAGGDVIFFFVIN